MIVSPSLSAIVSDGVNVNELKINIKFGQWTERNRNAEERSQIKKIITQPIIDAGVKIVPAGSNYDMDITFNESSTLIIGVGSSIKWDLMYVIKDRNQKELLRKSYDGNIKGEEGKRQEGGVVVMGVNVNFKKEIDDIISKLKRNPLFPPKNK